MKYINVESDFKLLESFDCNCEVNLKDSEFTFVYYTKQYSDNKVEVSYKGDECTNCKFTEDNRLIVLFENHNLEPGTLKVKRYFNLNDADFSDKTCDFVIEEELPISLTKGIQPCTEECCYVDVKLPPYYQKGDIGPVGPKGDKGDQGDKGDKGDLTVTGATPHNNLLDNTAFNQFDYEDNLSYWNIRGSAEIEIHGGENGIGNNALLIKSYEDLADNTVNPSTLCIKGIGYVLSLYTKAYNNEKRTLLINIPNLHRGLFYVDGQQGKLNNLGYISLEQSTNWEKHYITFTVSGESPIFFAAPSTANDGVLIAQVKLESNPINGLPDLANLMPTPWTLSANDLKGKDIYELLVESNKFEGTRKEFEDDYINSINNVKNATNHAIIEANNAQMISQHVQQVERDIIQRDSERSEAFDLAQSNRQQAYEDAENIRNSEYRKAESSRNSGFGSAENTRNNIFLQYESTRQNNETLRSNAEEDRKKAESDRQALFQSNEESRQNTFNTNETTRQNNEIRRQTKEAERETKEAERQSIFSTNEAERQRIFETNDAIRQENEDKRVAAETLRQEAETIREATYRNKVDREDNAPKLTAGFANNLVGRGEATPQEISFRPSGGDTSIEDGTARIERVKGSTVVWNQCVNIKSVEAQYEGALYILSLSNGLVTVTKNEGGTISSDSIFCRFAHRFIASRKYLIIYNLQRSDGQNTEHYIGSSGIYDGSKYHNLITAYGMDYKFFSPTESFTSILIQIAQNVTVGVALSYTLRPVIYDLTQMFGAGNEPTTIEEFNARKPLGIDEYAYNEGELISTNVDEVKSVGFNAWDEEWELGSISTDTGNDVDSTKLIRSKNYIPIVGGYTYFFSSKAILEQFYAIVATYDENYNFLGHIDKGIYFNSSTTNTNYNNPCTFNSNVAYIRFRLNTSYGPTYNHDICIHLVHTGYRNGEYEPYKEFRRNIPIKDIKDKDGNQLFPNGLLSAGSVYDEITATKAIKRIGVVDLGTISWAYFESFEVFTSITLQRLAKFPTVASDTPNLTSIYDATTYNVIRAKQKDKAIGFNPSGTLLISDTSFGIDVESFKAAMQGVMLYYELAEPIEIDLEEPLNLDYEVSDFGTEEVISDVPTTPMKADIIYQFNAVDRIRDNSRHTAEADAKLLDYELRIKALEAIVASLTSSES